MKKNMLILGGEGFIGRNCLEYFLKQDKYNITVFRHINVPHFGYADSYKGYSYFDGDLRMEHHVKRAMEKQHIVLQMAATTTGAKDVIEQPWIHVTDNAVMNSWIFREAVMAGVEHVIFPSCTVMYQPKEESQSEDDWSASDEIYEKYFGVGNTKVYLEKMCDFYSRIEHDNNELGMTKFTAIRHSNIYGPYDKFDLDKCHVTPALINKIVNTTCEYCEPECNHLNCKGKLEIWGTGKAKRDLLYIDDLVDMIDKVIEYQHINYALVNCGFGKAFSINEIANTIMKIEGKNLKKVYNINKPDIPTTVVLNCQRAKDWFYWEPKTSLEDGLRKTIDWYKREILKYPNEN